MKNIRDFILFMEKSTTVINLGATSYVLENLSII